MNYLLNNKCVFNECNHEIKNTVNCAHIKMTAMRARCLNFLIENRDLEIISRESITHALWGERGQFVSDANLTQLLYLIRKDLRSLGIDDFFITIPRMGIRVNTDITISPFQPEAPKRRAAVSWKQVIAAIAAATGLGACLMAFH